MWAKSPRERCTHDRATSDVRIFKNITGSVLIRLEKYCYLLAGIYVIGIQYVCLADKISVQDKFQFIKTYLLAFLNLSTYILLCKYTNIQTKVNSGLSLEEQGTQFVQNVERTKTRQVCCNIPPT